MNKYIILLIFIIMAGCGYTTKGFMYPQSSIIIKPVVNTIDITAESRKYSGYTTFPVLIENRLTNEIVSKFNNDGNLRVVNQDPDALKLTCVITSYTREALRYSEDEDVEEQRLRLHVQMTLEVSDGRVLNKREVVGESSYFLTGTRAKSESSAQKDLINDTARRISEAVLEEW